MYTMPNPLDIPFNWSLVFVEIFHIIIPTKVSCSTHPFSLSLYVPLLHNEDASAVDDYWLLLTLFPFLLLLLVWILQVELVNDNLFEWYVRLQRVDPDSPLARDMLEQKVSHILLHLVFPDNFPFAPPFMRVVEPRIEKGYVMDGGAICMELLTPRGWASAYTVEALLMQFSASLVKGQGRIAKSVKTGTKEFSR